MATQNLTALLLEASRAEFMERNHQRICRARSAGRDCLACTEYEVEWMAAENAVHEFQVQLARAS